MEQEKISVILPVYNGAAWIGECIRSIQAQTWKNWELLVLDDSSRDGTGELVQRFAGTDGRIRLVNRKKKGVSSARNQGIAETDGAYFTFVDADDKLAPRMFEVLAACLETEKSDLAVCDYYRWDGTETGVFLRSGEKIPADRDNSVDRDNPADRDNSAARENPARAAKTVDAAAYLADYLLRGNTRCWSALYRRRTAGSVRFREELSIGEDMMFLMDLLPALSRVTITDYRGYYYRVNLSGAMLRPFTPSYMDEVKSWRLACRRVESLYPAQRARVYSILAVSAMLAAGKLARLSGKERAGYRAQIAACKEAVREALAVPGAKRELPPGYRFKTGLYRTSPALYLALYHFWKREEAVG
ncbi:MAG: glycosyltransferase family 2 protein [Eubacteriales bacterium]|nr:glycosyltransferase family 2 protein [Eubacteriales bacterium]